MTHTKDLLTFGRAAIADEGAALSAAGERLGTAFVGACEALLGSAGKVVLTGLGKSGHVARKVASTLSSTGTSAFFLHPTEALHGDFGMLQPSDCLVAIAYGGETTEVVEVARYARRIGLPVISITGKLQSPLAKLSHFAIDGSVAREADAFNLAPTSSSTVAIALGDAIAVTLMRARGFTQGDFASLHPGGSLGRRLSLVRDHMHSGGRLPTTTEGVDFHAVLEAVTAHNFGIVAVVDAADHLVGAISDGDLRRALLKRGASALTEHAHELMTKNPQTVLEKALALDAVNFMNERQITQLFVLGTEGRGGELVGLVRLHDLLAAKIL